jgi:SET domain-containing protein
MPGKRRPPGLAERLYKSDSPIHGQGCFALVGFRAGEYIGTYGGPDAVRDGRYVLWVKDDDDRWIGRSGRNLLRWLNHSDTPNAAFDGFDLYALSDISAGEEITFDYGAGTAEE